MERKLKSRENRNKHHYTPHITALVVFVIFMGVRVFTGTDADIQLTLVQTATLFFAPLLLGWFTGWAIRFRLVERRYTKRGISVSLAQFLISLLPTLIIVLSLLAIYISAKLFGTALESEVDSMPAYIGAMMCVITVIATLGLSLYTRLSIWLRQWFALSHLD